MKGIFTLGRDVGSRSVVLTLAVVIFVGANEKELQSCYDLARLTHPAPQLSGLTAAIYRVYNLLSAASQPGDGDLSCNYERE